MPSPIESAGSAAEKIAPLVKFPILMRIVMPGAIASVWLYPLVHLPSAFAGIPLSFVWQRLAYVVGMIAILGTAASALRPTTYQIYKGTTLWPGWLRRRLRARLQARVDRLLADAKRIDPDDTEISDSNGCDGSGRGHVGPSERDLLRLGDIWYELRAYPEDPNGDPSVVHPTLLGNILAGYEEYPWTRYGMDPVFYWPRIWIQLEKEKKEEIDSNGSPAEGFLSASATAYCGGLLWLLAAALGTRSLAFLRLTLPFCNRFWTLMSALCLIVLGYCLYRLSLDLHRLKGETFKSVFDLYRDRLTTMGGRNEEDILRWKSVWAYLQYYEVPCRGCQKLVSAREKYCAKCRPPENGPK